jgi:RimJ/RimL family protein N-acetyltransferase
MPRLEITTTHLELRSPEQHRPGREPPAGLTVRRVDHPSPALNHFFFVEVGRPFRWYSRLGWDYEDWRRWVERPQVVTAIGYLDGTPIGYYELEQQQENASVEILFFGLLPAFLGQGLGGPFLSVTVEDAWALGPERVWLHTCTEDHPAALANYRARGFTVFARETKVEELPDDDDPRWLTPAYYESLQKYCTQK